MKTQFNNYLLFGMATGLLLWSVQEFFLLAFQNLGIPVGVSALVLGIIFGSILGCCIGLEEGFLNNSRQRLKKGAILGGFSGAACGLISFFLFDQIAQTMRWQNVTDPIYINLLVFFQWFVLIFLIAVTIRLKEYNHLQTIRGVFIGTISGLLGGSIILIIKIVDMSPFWGRFIGFTSLAVIFSLATLIFNKYNQKQWLKALNGSLEGQTFELSNEFHFIGTQNSDDIYLAGYKDINSTHAKLLKYSYGYSLIDNDPFGHTYVNFRNVTEQPLKSGDILKIGTATFQYCVR